MYLHDFGNNTIRGQAAAPAARTTTLTGSAIDMLQGDGQCMALLDIGTWTDGTFTGKIQESDTTTTGDFGDISGATFTAISANAPGYQVISFLRTKRYLRLVMTVTASPGTGLVFGCMVAEQQKFVAPGQ